MRIVWRILDSSPGKMLLNGLSNLRVTNSVVKKVISKDGMILTPRARKVIQEALPSQTQGVNRDDLQIGIVTREKDSKFLELCIAAIKLSHPEVSNRIHIVCPDEDFETLRHRIDENVAIHCDSEFLNPEIEKKLSRIDLNRRGWIRQQIIKVSFSAHSENLYTLLVDSDTLLLKHQLWIDQDGRQLLAISQEYHPPYDIHFQRYFRDFFHRIPRKMRVSFVTHHQVMQKQILSELFSFNINGLYTPGLIKWLNAIDPKESSGACEWHTYASFLLSEHPDQVNLYRWLNTPVAPKKIETLNLQDVEMTLNRIVRDYPLNNSISLHHYLR
jgi:hypothetical protein